MFYDFWKRRRVSLTAITRNVNKTRLNISKLTTEFFMVDFTVKPSVFRSPFGKG